MSNELARELQSSTERLRASVQAAEREQARRKRDPFAALLTKLIDSTDRGLVEWRAVEDRPDRFETDLADGNVEVGSVDGDERSPWELCIYRYQSGALASADFVDAVSGRDEAWRNEALGDLHRSARRSALAITSLVAAMIDELDGLG